jgi:hypothetical protein
MMHNFLAKLAIALGLIIWTIPFLSAVLLGSVIIALIWVKDKMVLVFNPSLGKIVL